ncbi:MAG: hypothetical protein WCJ54_07465 [Actinomycetota bacterium]
MKKNPEELRAEGALKEVMNEFNDFTDGPSQAPLLIPERKIAILVNAIKDKDRQIESLEDKAMRADESGVQLEAANATIEELQNILNQERIVKAIATKRILGGLAVLEGDIVINKNTEKA